MDYLSHNSFQYVLTADWTMEQRMSNTESVDVDSGTQAGSHVPEGDF